MDGFHVMEHLATSVPGTLVIVAGSADEALAQRCSDFKVSCAHKNPDYSNTIEPLIRKNLRAPLAPTA